MDESKLVENLQAEDQSAFKELFDNYKDYIFNICYRMTGNIHDAEDVTQEVFIKILRSIGNFRGDAGLSSWIYRIAVNTCLNRERRKRFTRLISLDFIMEEHSAPDPYDKSQDPYAKLEQAEKERLVQEAIQSLPARQKTAVILSRYEDLSYRQVAEVMGVSVPAVESLLHRAKNNLSKKLISMMK